MPPAPREADLDAGGTAEQVPGEPGLWLLLLGDMTVFAALFGAFLVERRGDPALFATGADDLHAVIGLAATMVLLTSSLAVAVAVRLHRSGSGEAGARAVGWALWCAAGFVVLKAVEWQAHLSLGHSPGENPFWTFYFAITGLHLVHLVIGSVLLLGVRSAMRRPAPPQDRRLLVESCTSYWHMVDLLWVLIFPLLYVTGT